MKMMLDLTGLPKNINGFRTTHTCELCGFEPKTKNKYREKQDHLVMKHFKEKIDKIFPHCRPYACPAPECTFTGKDKQALLRHYTGKHGILEKYLREALAEKGINYSPSENGKRRHSEVNGNSKNGHKNPRLSLTPPGNIMPVSPEEAVTTPTNLVSTIAKPITIASRPNTEELRKEVEAMMRSFQPEPVIIQVNGNPVSQVNGNSTTNGHPTNGHSATTNGLSSNGIIVQPQSNSKPVTSAAAHIATSLPSIVLSAVASATAASVAAKAAAAAAQTNGHSNNNNNNNNTTTTTTVATTNTPICLPTQPANVPTITISKNGSINGPSPNAMPLPIEIITNGNVETILPDIKQPPETPKSPMVENEDVMWSAANSLTCTANVNGTTTATITGPAVVVEAANSLPIAYIDGIDTINFSAASAANMETANIDFDYLYPVTTAAPTPIAEVRERQLEFSML